MLNFLLLDQVTIDGAAALVAAEQVAARARRSRLPLVYADPRHCHVALEELLAADSVGFVAYDGHRCVGVICGRTIGSVGFVPTHGLAVDPDLEDSTAVVVGLLGELAPILLRDGAMRFTIDHVDLEPLGAALHNAGFGRWGVFATHAARPTAAARDVDVRVGTFDDLDAIAALSQIELAHRSTPPIYAHPQLRTLAEARAAHERLLDDGAVHFLARTGNRDVGLVTVEFTTPAPRLCRTGEPYIGPTATHHSRRGRGVGRALVDAVLGWAHGCGHETVSVDFESSNPLSRPFWLGMGFQPVGYRVQRTIDTAFTVRAATASSATR
jgi:GNAT superfamily N-acetyltransferase